MNLVKLMVLFVLVLSVSANEYFNEKKYDEAFPQVQQEALKGSKASMYRLGYMYMNGLGVKKDIKKSAYWFEKSASEYRYTLDVEPESKLKKMPLVKRVLTQINPATNKLENEFTFRKIDNQTKEVQQLLSSLSNANFYGMQPYKTNYMLPISYASHRYDTGGSKTEIHFQFSFKKPLTYDLFGLNEYFTLAYTQKLWWQMYTSSSPFRETNYLPELYMLVPTSQGIDEILGLKFVKYSLLHESNGRDGYGSRSWNRFYISGKWQWGNFFLSSRVWYRFKEHKKYVGYYDKTVVEGDPLYDADAKGDDNPSMYRYYGYGDVKFNYFFHKHEMGSLLRYNFNAGGKNRGAIDVHYSYPFFNSKNTFFYIKFFNGYGESLIDYNHCVTKTSVGFSFSREVF